MEFHFFPPKILPVILLCFPPLLSWNIFLRNVSSFTKPGTCGKHSPQSSTPSKQKSSRNLFYSSRNAFHAIFNTTRALDSREYTNSWKFPCKPNVSVIEKGETRALPHLRDFFGSFFLGALWFSSRNIQDHSFHARFGEWNDTLDGSVINFIPKFPFL